MYTIVILVPISAEAIRGIQTLKALWRAPVMQIGFIVKWTMSRQEQEVERPLCIFETLLMRGFLRDPLLSRPR